MTPTELATIILMICGTGESDKTLDCRDFMVNCAVTGDGNIDRAKVIECTRKEQSK